MNCKEFEEQITPAVDRNLGTVEMELFGEHAGRCPHCRFEYESELVTKRLVGERLKPVRTPQELTDAIAAGVHRRGASPFRVGGTLMAAIKRRPYVTPLLAFAITCVAVILLIRNPESPTPTTASPAVSTASVGGNDVILQSLATYRAMVDGSIKPQMVSTEPEHLKSFFNGKTEFPVLVPTMKECTLVGGVLNDYDGTMLAHVLYRRNTQLVYMYQACWKTVMQGEKLNLPANAKSQLEQTGWYTESFPDGNSIVMWTKGQTLCSAVSHMPKEDLVACLTSNDEGAVNPW